MGLFFLFQHCSVLKSQSEDQSRPVLYPPATLFCKSVAQHGAITFIAFAWCLAKQSQVIITTTTTVTFARCTRAGQVIRQLCRASPFALCGVRSLAEATGYIIFFLNYKSPSVEDVLLLL